MALTDLPATLQTLVLFNFDSFVKIFIPVIFLVFALSYVLYFKKEEQPTNYLLIGLARLFITIASWIYVCLFPLFIFLLSPQLDTSIIFNWLLIVYLVGFIVGAVIVMINVLYLGPIFLIKIVGVTVHNERVSSLLDKLFGKSWRKYYDGQKKMD